MLDFNYLVRFQDESGNIHYGEAEGSKQLEGQTVRVYDGESPWDKNFSLSQKTSTISKVSLCSSLNHTGYSPSSGTTPETDWKPQVLCPLASTPLIHGVGLNYKAHAEEGNVRTAFVPIFSNAKLIRVFSLAQATALPNHVCQIPQ